MNIAQNPYGGLKLASGNEYVYQMYEILIEKSPRDSRAFISSDSAKDDTNNYYQEEYLNI